MFESLFTKNISENPLWKEQLQSRIALRDINIKVWWETNIFSPVWWLMVIMYFLLWLLWWKLVEKSRLIEIITYGLLISSSFMIFDMIATQIVLWGYPNRLTPFSPPIVFEDLCLLPIIYMLVYQYFDSWKSFSIAIILTSLILAFVGEPLFISLDILQLNKWKCIYSLPLYIFLGVFFKFIMSLIKNRQYKAKV